MKRYPFFLVVLTASATVQGQGTLISPSLRNGSFEDGVSAPWGLVTVVQDAAFASQGTWFARVQAAGVAGGTARTDSYQDSLLAAPIGGLVFMLNFDARAGAAGFDTASALVTAWNGDGTFQTPTVTVMMSPSLSSVAWASYQYRFELPSTWDGGGNARLDINFNKAGAQVGTVYSGYLDNVTLQQIPEPASVALLAMAGLVLAVRLSRGVTKARTVRDPTRSRWRALEFGL